MAHQLSAADAVELLDRLDYYNVDRLRQGIHHDDHSATPNTVMSNTWGDSDVV